MRLTDLEVHKAPFAARPASVADLVDALIAEGGEIQDTQYQRPAPWHNWVLLAPKKGRYLVFPLPVEEPTST